MKASELIKSLVDTVAQHGDLDILVRDCEDGCDWNGLTVCPDPPSPMEAEQGIIGTIDINVFADGGAEPIDCDSQECAYNHNGECRFRYVKRRDPKIDDERGCGDYSVSPF